MILIGLYTRAWTQCVPCPKQQQCWLPAPRKHDARSPSSSPVPVSTSAKHSRVTGPAVVNNMVDALLHMANSFNGRDAALAMPTCHARAVKAVSADKSLSQGDRVKAIQLFTTDIAVCNSYMAIDVGKFEMTF